MLLSVFLGACSGSQTSYKTADHWSKEGYVQPLGARKRAGDVSLLLTPAAEKDPTLQTPHRSPALAKASLGGNAPGSFGRIAPPEPTRARLLQGEQCLRELTTTGVHYRPLTELKGIENPVVVLGPLGGVDFWANDGRPLQMDCRLALALQALEPVFKQHGLSRARYSGAYVYRRTKSGRLSHHAHGLAIDIHELHFASTVLSVKEGYARKAGCRASNPAPNRLFCSMREARLFEEFLTPDYNYDHRDHLHLSVPRRASEPFRSK